MFYTPDCLIRRSRYIANCARARFANWSERWTDPAASDFFDALMAGGFDPQAHIDVLPQHKLLYVCVPKCASTTVKAILSALNGRTDIAPQRVHNRRHSTLRSPAQISLSAFHRLATSPAALRFAFVRNPYARLVSAWADKFRDKPLVPGDSFVDHYLAHRASFDQTLPHGQDRTLSFAEFVNFAIATAYRRVDAHWHSQSDLLAMPGITLDVVGKVETFSNDFMPVLEHVRAEPTVRRRVAMHMNATPHFPWQDYYSDQLAARVYRTYEPDFDLFAYPRDARLAT